MNKFNYYFFIALTILTFLVFPTNTLADTLIFQDDFEDGNADGWIVTGSPTNWSVVNGEYGIIVPSGVTNTIPSDVVWGLPISQYIFEADIRGVQGTDKNIIVKYQDEQNFYEVHHTLGSIFFDKHTTNGGYSLGVVNYPLLNNETYHFKFEVNGNIFKIYVNNYLLFDVEDEFAPVMFGKIGLRAGTGAVAPTEVWFDNVVVTSLEPEPQPVLVIPGMGASWNADALLNCEDEGYYGNWELSPFAEDIYNPLLQTLAASEHDVIPYYYDWRKDVSHHTQSLSNLIQSQSTDSYIVGHSMGGLLGRAYLEFTKENSNLDKLMTVGSPHQGAVLAYPAWSAGEVWSDNLLQRIAMTVAIKRCSGLFGNDRVAVRNHIPSAQNLLPTFNYLFNKNLQQEIAVSSQDAQNNWLPNNDFPSPFYGVQVGTLSGTGFSTLYKLDVKDANKKDLKEGNWMDGDPTKKYHTDLGDGTVRTSSSGLAGALINRVINKNHSDLVKSSEGINEILDFLDISITPLSATSSTPESALIIMSPDAEVKFELEQESSSATGISVILSPTSKNYKINVNTIKDESTIIVAQFLPNDKTLWTEYKVEKGTYKGILKFNRSKIEEDILEWN